MHNYRWVLSAVIYTKRNKSVLYYQHTLGIVLLSLFTHVELRVTSHLDARRGFAAHIWHMCHWEIQTLFSEGWQYAKLDQFVIQVFRVDVVLYHVDRFAFRNIDIPEKTVSFDACRSFHKPRPYHHYAWCRLYYMSVTFVVKKEIISYKWRWLMIKTHIHLNLRIYMSGHMRLFWFIPENMISRTFCQTNIRRMFYVNILPTMGMQIS